jgi:uncharacterized protein (DUF924 family)
MTDPRVDDILAFWFGPPTGDGLDAAARWYKRDPAFDDEIRTRFRDDLARASRGELDAWSATPRGALALVVLLDQFTRNMFREGGDAFSNDPRALAITRAAIAAGHDRALPPLQRWMLYMPLMHAEDRDVQKDSLALFEKLIDDSVSDGTPEPVIAFLRGGFDYAIEHAKTIERFGRFPHRNAMLNRTSTGDEVDFLLNPPKR